MRKYTLSLLSVMFIVCLGVPAYDAGISGTGQNLCYNDAGVMDCPAAGADFYGQDAQNREIYGLISRSFTKMDESGNLLPDDAGTWAMVRDNVTGLIWEIKTDDESIHDRDNKFNWYDVQTGFIEVLKGMNEGEGFGGFGGADDPMPWRLPSRSELLSIAHYQSFAIGMADNYLPHIQSGISDYYMSGNEKNNTANIWVVLLGSGTDQYFNMSKTTGRYVIAVRGTPMDYPVLQDNENGTVTDTRNGLTWTQNGTSASLIWKDALAYVAGLNQQEFAGKTDWRLPNAKELASLVDLRKNNPAVDPLFNVQPSPHWTSTTDPNAQKYAYSIDFNNGGVGSRSDKKATVNDGGQILAAAYAIAVRGGQYGTFAVKGDLNADGKVDLADVIISLSVCAGMEDTGFSSPFALADISIDGDEQIGMGEAIYALQMTAGIVR